MIHNLNETIVIPKTFFIVSVFLTVFILMLLCCGKKGPPESPSRNRPPAVRDLGYNIINNKIKLRWTIPEIVEKGLSPIIGFIVYRSKLTRIEANCPNCPIRYAEVGDVPVRGAAAEVGESRSVVFSQEIEKGYYYYYKILAYNDVGAFSRDSNVVEFYF